MPEEATNARLTRVESDIAEVRRERREDIHGLHEKMDALIATVAAQGGSHGMDNVRLRGELEAVKARMCPKPGYCAELAPRLELLEDKCGKMHDLLQQAKGGGKVISGIWGAIGASVVGCIVWVVTHFITTGKP